MTVTIEDAQARLPELIHHLNPGESVVITSAGEPVARLTAEARPQPPRPRKPGSARDKILYIAPDFDAPLDEFREYME